MRTRSGSRPVRRTRTRALAAGTYYYLVDAEDAAGNISGSSNQASATVSPPSPPVYLVGDQTIEAKGDFNAAGLAEAFKTTAAATGTVTKISVFVDSTSRRRPSDAGVYADTAGHPGVLLSQGSLNAPAAGAWNDVQVPSAQVAAGTTYWIALLGPAGAGTLRFRTHGAGGSAGETSAQATLTSLPATWSTGSRNTDGPFSAWAGGDGPSGPPPGQVGQWSSPSSWPIVAVHMSLLPTGNVLAFDAWDAAPNSQTVWNPTTGTFVAGAVRREPILLGARAAGGRPHPDRRRQRAGGRGHQGRDVVRLRDEHVVEGRRHERRPLVSDRDRARQRQGLRLRRRQHRRLRACRIRPSYFKEASPNSLPTIYDPASNTWQDLTSSKLTTPLYPFMFQLSDGRILDAGPDVTTRVLNPGTWTWSTVTTSPFDGGDAVMYLPDKIMKSGSYANPDYYGSATYNTVSRHSGAST